MARMKLLDQFYHNVKPTYEAELAELNEKIDRAEELDLEGSFVSLRTLQIARRCIQKVVEE